MEQERIVVAALRHRTQILAFVRLIVRDAHLAEDVFQEATALALQKRDEIQDEAHLLAWIRRAARFKALHVMRQRNRLVFNDSLLDQVEARWDELVSPLEPEVSESLRRCLEGLTPNARRIVELRYGEGVSGQRLADALERELNTVYVALSRIHRLLAECVRRRLGPGGLVHG